MKTETDRLTLEEILGSETAAAKEIQGAVIKADPGEMEKLWEGFDKMTPQAHVEWLRHFIALEWHLSRLVAGWIPATPNLKWRLEWPLCMFEDMQHAALLRERLLEFSKSPGAIELAPRMARFLQSIAPADSAFSFYAECVRWIKPAVLNAYRAYLDRCDDIIDGPMVFTLRRIIFEKETQLRRIQESLSSFPLPPAGPDADAYGRHVRACLEALGGLTPEGDPDPVLPENPVRNPIGPAPEKELHDPALEIVEWWPDSKKGCPVQGTVREIIYHNATEWQVIGPMCYAYHEMTEMPFEFFVDFSRHIWDECRHSLMGFRRLAELGFRPEDFVWPAAETRPKSVQDYVAMLTLVGEACSFKRKQGSIVPFLRAGDQRSAILPTIDCVDERMHVGYGNRWVPEIYKRYKKDERPFAEIAKDTRSRVLQERGLLVDKGDKRRQLSGNLPLFCSALEFSNLNFSEY